MNSSVNQSIHESDVRSSVLKLKLGRNIALSDDPVALNWGIQQDNDPKHSNYTRMAEKAIAFSGLSSQSPDLILKPDLKCFDKTLRELCLDECLETSMNWKENIKKSGPESLLNNVRDW